METMTLEEALKFFDDEPTEVKDGDIQTISPEEAQKALENTEK